MTPSEQAALRVLRSGRFIGGPEVAALETELADFCGGPSSPLQTVACASGTSALVLCLLALDLRPSDEVICPDFSFVATASPVALLGGVPRFADIEPIGYGLDPEKIEPLITPRTKGILCASLFGQCAQLEKISAIAQKHGLWLIEDGAQSFGARRLDWMSCSCAHSDLAFTSFYPSKPLAACGDGGAVFSKNPELTKKLRMLRDHGAESKNLHSILGLNSRLDALQAAILREKLKDYGQEIERRNQMASSYATLFASLRHSCRGESHSPVFVDTPKVLDGNTHIWSLYTLRCADRNAVLKQMDCHASLAMTQKAIHYPLPLHKQPCFAGIPGVAQTIAPNAEKACNEVLNLYV
jgi:UDP-2-acetamido-2-deoxy-ribo-hexuluronate aminotransferase